MAQLDLSNVEGGPILLTWSYRSGSTVGALVNSAWLNVIAPTWARWVAVRADSADLLLAVPGPPNGTPGYGETDTGAMQRSVPVFAGGPPVQLPLGPDPQAADADRCDTLPTIQTAYRERALGLWSATSGARYSLVFSRYRSG